MLGTLAKDAFGFTKRRIELIEPGAGQFPQAVEIGVLVRRELAETALHKFAPTRLLAPSFSHLASANQAQTAPVKSQEKVIALRW